MRASMRACTHACPYACMYVPATLSTHKPVCTVRAVPLWGTHSTHTRETVGTTVFHCVCVRVYACARV